jgi:peptidoglycan/xylan/chitin deacetylase (PgdA/CDA1 family)/GT2 family glycosyltransferase
VNGAPERELSVVIATHNRRERLRRCLEALARQSAEAGSFEVIVAGDGCDDGTAEMVEALETTFPLRALQLEKAGKPAALNAAIEVAAGSACLFIDDDVVASAELVSSHVQAHREDPLALAVGRLTQPAPSGGGWFERAHAAAWNERYDELEGRAADWPDTYGGNFSAPTAKLREVGGFNATLSAIEDIELGHRLCEAGCRARYLPRAAAVHEDEKPRGRLIADVERYGAFCAVYAEDVPVARRRLLGWFLEPTPREVALRRLLLAFRIPPAALAVLGGLIPGTGRKQVWFGFVNRYVFWRGARSGMNRRRWLQTTRGVPVLMYHAFGERDEGDRYVISRRAFARQLRLLRTLRYRPIAFSELARMLAAGEALASRTVVITIDDGYADNLEIAKPLLRRGRFPATVFLVSRGIGGVNEWTDEGAVSGRRLLTEGEVKELDGDGIEIGAHTRTHPSLTATAAADLDGEIRGSREDLEALLGAPVPTFAYPFGQFDPPSVAAADRAGFTGACTVESRLARLGDDPLEIPRLEIKGEDSLRTFLRKLWLGGA